MMHHSSRVHVTRDTVFAHVCKGDISSASKPITRFGSIEYLRALRSQVQRFEETPADVPEGTLYLIDKMVRLRAKESKFGFDHSEVLNLERELLDPFVEGTNELRPDRGERLDEEVFSKKLMEKLSHTVPGNQTPGLNFEDWKRKKEAEARLKSKLIEDAIQEEVKRKVQEEEMRLQHLEEAKRKAEEWNLQKRLEARRRLLDYEQRKQTVEETTERKKQKAEEEFKKWLKQNFVKLREAKRLERIAQKNEKLSQAEHERLLEERKWQCEQHFQTWVRTKNSQVNRSTNSVISKTQKTKKPIMLAYSPNRKLKGCSSPTSLDNPSKYTISEAELVQDISNTEELKSSSQSSASSQRVEKGGKKEKRVSEDVQPIDELSSIQRTSHQGGHFGSGEEDVEGFISSGNEELSDDA